MITDYTIKNFRVFDKKGVTIEFAPLTFLVGCNSSGKSSIVKSLSLLNSFFMNVFDKDHPVIGSTIDFSVKPIDSLGTFNNVVRYSSRKKEISLSYETHSYYINDDVVVTLTMGNGELGNATITAISISKKDGTVLIATTPGHSTSGNLVSIKEAFKQYLIATRFRSNVRSLLPSDPDMKLSQDSRNRIKELEEEAVHYCSSEYLIEVYNNREIAACRSNEYVKRSIDKFAETGIMTYFSIFEEMSNLATRDEVSSFLKSRVKEGELHDTMMKVIDFVSASFEKSGSPDFPSYYRSLEDSRVFATENVSSKVLKGDQFGFRFFSPFDLNRENLIYTICEREDVIEKVQLFDLVYDMLFHLVGNEPYSYVLRGEHDYEPMMHRLHPLFEEAFMDYVEKFWLEVVSKDITEGLDYISSSRIQVRRMYTMEDRNEFSDAVRRYFETKTRFMTLSLPISINVWNEDGRGTHKISVSDFVPGSFMNKWLQIFKIGHHMSLEMDHNGLGLLLKVYRSSLDKKGVLLADMGYGITQLFSILLQIEEMIMSALFEKFKSIAITKDMNKIGAYRIIGGYEETPFEPRTVAIEEPEIHLHPKYQSLLAEMLYEAYKDYNIQFIIETHSEYLLRKIQTLVGAKKLVPEEVSMIYVEDDEEVAKGAPKVRRIRVKEDGCLASPFSPGFYDEADNLSLELFTNTGR